MERKREGGEGRVTEQIFPISFVFRELVNI